MHHAPLEEPHDKTPTKRIAHEVDCSVKSVIAALRLFHEGGTVPFIARYRKEWTGGLDENQLRSILSAEKRIIELESRRDAIRSSLAERELLTPELSEKLAHARSKTELEDLYLPYRPRRATRADQAREGGFAPLAQALRSEVDVSVATIVRRFAPKDASASDALPAAGDIIAEEAATDPTLRRELRGLFETQGAITSERSKGTTDKKKRGGPETHSADTYRDYFSWREPARDAPSHRVLALLRGSNEGHLRVTLRPPESAAVKLVERWIAAPFRTNPPSKEHRRLFRTIAEDAWKRLIAPSLEREALRNVRERAVRDAIAVFQRNLEAILLASPFGPRRILAIDPGLRTGCKIAVLDATGEVLTVDQIYPLPPKEDTGGAGKTIRDLCAKYKIEGIAIGDGTGGREAESFVRGLDVRRADGEQVVAVSVHEAGASVYSASEYAGMELPDMDVQYRGAVSIGRRLQDPLAELVKIDPQAIGVGQYQHDVEARALEEALSDTVVSCVNRVGVDINTASVPLLTRVSGLTQKLAERIVAVREKNGLFESREEIGKITGIGSKTVEQAVGFLRCYKSMNVLERTAVHPERYALVATMCHDIGVSVDDLLNEPERIDEIEGQRYVDETLGIGTPTIADIQAELRRPGRDPRADFVVPKFDPAINSIDDVQPEQVLFGIVRNVVDFGAFVDIGVHRDGLVHVSELSDTFVTEPSQYVAPGQHVRVQVIEVDRERKRIQLRMKGVPQR